MQVKTGQHLWSLGPLWRFLMGLLPVRTPTAGI